MIEQIKQKLEQHHQLYRFPVKGELWEDIFDQVINGNNGDWNMGGHDVGTDVVSHSDGLRYQNKAGVIDIEKGTLVWSGHRTTKHKTLNEKVEFISENHCDKYIMLARNKKEWDNGIRRYYLLSFDSDLIDYNQLNWEESLSPKNNTISGWVGKNENLNYSAKIVKSMSDQLWTEARIDYLGDVTPITIV